MLSEDGSENVFLKVYFRFLIVEVQGIFFKCKRSRRNGDLFIETRGQRFINHLFYGFFNLNIEESYFFNHNWFVNFLQPCHFGLCKIVLECLFNTFLFNYFTKIGFPINFYLIHFSLFFDFKTNALCFLNIHPWR